MKKQEADGFEGCRDPTQGLRRILHEPLSCGEPLLKKSVENAKESTETKTELERII